MDSVVFDVTVFVRNTCPLACHVAADSTMIEINLVGTTVILNVADEPLITLADNVALAASAMLRDRRSRRPDTDIRPLADPDDDTLRPPIRTDTIVDITGPCPMSFDVQENSNQIVVCDSETLTLLFDDQSLLTFALLMSEAARTVSARTNALGQPPSQTSQVEPGQL